MEKNSNLIIHSNRNQIAYDIEKKCVVNEHIENIALEIQIEKKRDSINNLSRSYNWTIDAQNCEMLELTTLAHAMRVHYRIDLCQTPSLPETSVRRALLSGRTPKKILLIGDDDLVSVPLAFLGHEVTVMDYDEYLVELIQDINKRFNLNIKVMHQNLMGKIESMHSRLYDVVYSDPVSTYEGFEAFVGKGLQMIKPNGACYISVSQRFSQIFEQFCKDSQIQIRNRYDKFSHYYDHRHVVIDDTADLFELAIDERTTWRYELDALITENIFESQKNLTFSTTSEVFNLEDSENAVIQKYINEKLFCLITGKPTKFIEIKGKNFVKSFFYSDETNTTIDMTQYESGTMQFTLVSQNVGEVSKFKHILSKLFADYEHRVEQVIFGVEKLRSREDLVVNEIF